MNLTELTTALLPHFPASMQKDLRTAVRMLAGALGCETPETCQWPTYHRPLPELYHALDTYLSMQHKGASTVRNTKNLISRLFRMADTQHLLTPPLESVNKPIHLPASFVIRRRAGQSYRWNDQSYLRRRDWPQALEADFIALERWSTNPVVQNRPARWRKRPSTLINYQRVFESFFGYMRRQLGIIDLRLDHVFDIALIEKYVHWHINEQHHRVTAIIRAFLVIIKTLAHQYHPNETLLDSLRTLLRSIPHPTPVYQKSDAWLSLRDIEGVSAGIWPTRGPAQMKSKAIRVASSAGISVMLHLWIYIPLRQRNMRIMQLGENLYQTPDGDWRLRFRGEQLKVASRHGQPNSVDYPIPPAVLPHLTEYLQTWRPLLSSIHGCPEVFLTSLGTAWDLSVLHNRLKRNVYVHTQRYFHPHIIRTVWATEWISSGGDFMTAAIMLNDKLETVIKNYAHLRDENVAEKAFEWVQNRVNHH